MHTSFSPGRFAGWLLITAVAGIAGLRAQTLLTRLEPVVTTANRLPEPSVAVGSAVDTISGADLERQQLSSIADALSVVPGSPAFQTGQLGGVTSVFLRGANSNQTLFLVDGIRLNDSNTDYAVFLGGASLFPGDSLEIVRGPQSTLYGSEAAGGVVSLRTQRGAGAPSQTVAVEGGSFGTLRGTAGAQGATPSSAYSVAVSGGHTDNTRPNNKFDTGSAAIRLDQTLLPDLSIGATLRGFTGSFGDPGDKYTNNRYNHEREGNWLGTVFADGQVSENFWTHLILGGQDRRFVATVPSPGQPTAVTVVKNRRAVADWQITGRMTEHNRLTSGITAEEETTRNTGFGDIDRRQKLFAWFAQDEWTPLPDLVLTGGVRRDDYDTFGHANTGRATAAWLTGQRALKLRGSFGTGFNSPSFLELYGQSAFFKGNPNLLPEKSRGWDAGFDFYVPDSESVLSATWFRTDFRNLIVYNFNIFPATTANVNRARTEGLELALKTPLAGSIQAKIAYTLLKATNLADQTRLLRRPRSSASADLWQDLGHGVSLGAGGIYVSRRKDVDAATFATVDSPAYTIVRVYAAWQATQNLTFKARIENASNKSYEPVNGYPALGRGFYGGAEYRF